MSANGFSCCQNLETRPSSRELCVRPVINRHFIFSGYVENCNGFQRSCAVAQFATTVPSQKDKWTVVTSGVVEPHQLGLQGVHYWLGISIYQHLHHLSN